MTITAARYAAVTSTLALAVALGGTSYAATQVGTTQIKNGAVTSAKIRDNTVTGADVREGTLARVPQAGYAANAGVAEAAGHATVAQRVGRTTVLDVSSSRLVGSSGTVIPIEASGLRVALGCQQVSGQTVMTLTATTQNGGSTIASVATTDDVPVEVHQADLEDGDFTTSDVFDVLAGDDGDIAHVDFTYLSSGGGKVSGTLLTDVAFRDLADPDDDSCRVAGFAFVTSDTF